MQENSQLIKKVENVVSTVPNKPKKPSNTLDENELKRIIQRIGRPWFDRKRRIPLWRIEQLRRAGFSFNQIGRLYSVSGTTIKRRMKGL